MAEATIRLDDQIARQRLQEDELERAYAGAVAENRHFPAESAAERDVMRARRDAREGCA